MSITLGDAILYLKTDDRQLQTGLGQAKTQVNSITGMLQGALSVAIGQGIAAVGQAAVSMLGNVIGGAFDATASFERMSMSMESLVAREMVNSQTAADGSAGAVMTVADAMKQAGPKARELLGWVEKLAINSPFSADDVALGLRTAMGYGFTADEAQRLAQANIDMAAATGKGGEVMNSVSYALGQIRVASNLSMQDLRQLMNAGVDVSSILGKMGYSLDDVGKKAIDNDAFIETFLTTMESDFAGAAAKQATSLAGLTESFGDLGKIIQRDLLSGVFKAFQPALAAVVDKLSSPAVKTAITNLGGLLTDLVSRFAPTAGEIGAAVDWVISGVTNMTAALLTGGNPFERLGAGMTWLAGLIPSVKQAIADVGSFLVSEVLPLLVNVNGIIVDALGPTIQQFSAYWTSSLLPALAQFWDWVQANIPPLLASLWEWFQTNLPAALQTTADFWNTVLLPALIAAADWVLSTLLPTLGEVWGSLVNLGQVVSANKDVIIGFLSGVALALGAIAVVNGPLIIAGLVNGVIAWAAAAWPAVAANLALVASWVVAAAPVIALAALVGALTAFFVKYGEGILGADAATATFAQKLQVGFVGAVLAASQSVQMLGQIIVLGTQLMLTQAGTALEQLLFVIGYELGLIPGKVSEGFTAMSSAGGALVGALWDGMSNKFTEFMGWLGGKIAEVTSMVAAAFNINVPAPSSGKPPVKRSIGGTLGADQVSWVGEKGPELRVWGETSTIFPNSRVQEMVNQIGGNAGGKPGVVNNYTYNLTAQYKTQEERELRDDIRLLQMLASSA